MRGAHRAAGFTLWQLSEQTPTQMMSYVIRTAGGRVVVIDGGNAGDAAYLRQFLARLGNRVEAWFLTHQHSDHLDAPLAIWREPGALEVAAIYGSLLDERWVGRWAVPEEKPDLSRLNRELAASRRHISDLCPGQTIIIDRTRIEVLAARNPQIVENQPNNSSVVLRVSDGAKSVVFLGDLGVEGGEKLLRGPLAGRLRADYVQMAHHGQNGVGRQVYEAAKPSCCLWPTPRWLWENDAGQGYDTGPWATVEVRAWMAQLGVTRHLVSWEGLRKVE